MSEALSSESGVRVTTLCKGETTVFSGKRLLLGEKADSRTGAGDTGDEHEAFRKDKVRRCLEGKTTDVMGECQRALRTNPVTSDGQS